MQFLTCPSLFSPSLTYFHTSTCQPPSPETLTNSHQKTDRLPTRSNELSSSRLQKENKLNILLLKRFFAHQSYCIESVFCSTNPRLGFIVIVSNQPLGLIPQQPELRPPPPPTPTTASHSHLRLASTLSPALLSIRFLYSSTDCVALLFTHHNDFVLPLQRPSTTPNTTSPQPSWRAQPESGSTGSHGPKPEPSERSAKSPKATPRKERCRDFFPPQQLPHEV